jgi:hypothetical protein
MTAQKQSKKSKIKVCCGPARPLLRWAAAPGSGLGGATLSPEGSGWTRPAGSLGSPPHSVCALCRVTHPQAFIKVVNYNHIMPTRYTLDLDLKTAVTGEATESTDKRVGAAKEAKKLLEERYKSGKNRCVTCVDGD